MGIVDSEDGHILARGRLRRDGTGPGTTTTVTNATGPVSGSLPTTGADLLLLGVAAVGTIGVGAGAVTLARCRACPGRAQNVRTGRMIRLRRVAFLLPSALSESLDSSQSPYSAWSVRIRRAASRASRDVPRGRYTTR